MGKQLQISVALNALVLTEDIEYTEKSPFLKGKVDWIESHHIAIPLVCHMFLIGGSDEPSQWRVFNITCQIKMNIYERWIQTKGQLFLFQFLEYLNKPTEWLLTPSKPKQVNLKKLKVIIDWAWNRRSMLSEIKLT